MERLTAEAFRAPAYRMAGAVRGFRVPLGHPARVAESIVHDAARSPVHDDAIRGLARRGPPITRRAGTVALSKARPRAQRYHDYLPVGAVVAVSLAVGSMAEEGQRGLVLRRWVQARVERYRVLFETGELETFDADLVDCHLAVTGIERAELAGYRWCGDAAALEAFRAGGFMFW